MHPRIVQHMLPRAAFGALVLAMTPAGFSSDGPDAPGAASGKSTGRIETLAIDLQDGFTGQFVEIRVDNRVVYGETVTTQLVTGLAESLAAEVDTADVEIVISVQPGGAAGTFTINLQQGSHLGLSLGRGGVQMIQSIDPFGYS